MLTSPMNRAALALAALTIAACGTTNAPQPTQAPTREAAETVTVTATPAITYAEFVEALNASCDKGTATADRLEKRFDSAMERNALPEAGRTYKQILPLLRAHVARAAKLDVPPADRSAMRRYMSAQQRIIGYGDRMAESLLDDDLAGVQLLVGPFQRERKRRITAAIDMGASKCGG